MGAVIKRILALTASAEQVTIFLYAEGLWHLVCVSSVTSNDYSTLVVSMKSFARARQFVLIGIRQTNNIRYQ